MKIGIDFGTKYTKIIAFSDSGIARVTSIYSKKVSRDFINTCIKKVKTDELIESFTFTGGNITFFPEAIDTIPVKKVSEWESLYDGIEMLHGKVDCIFVNCGSGTSIHLLTREVQKHIGGSALGGATIDNFMHYFKVNKSNPTDSLSSLHASVGSLVGSVAGLDEDWPGVYFNNLDRDTSPEDIVAALEQVVADEILNIASIYAKSTLHDTFLFSGGTFKHTNFEKRIQYWIKTRNMNVIKHDWNPFISLIGLVGLPKSIEIK